MLNGNDKTDLVLALWNVGKMKEMDQLNTICDEMDRKNLEILGISETLVWQRYFSKSSYQNCNLPRRRRMTRLYSADNQKPKV